ncbi:phosphatase PAP2 family protein [Nocardioides sp.]|uniref:phosphatase PAP2 family protein n=1 Tax=Nocardioides sp. TaxID=35761 RepID=UPI003567AD9F
MGRPNFRFAALVVAVLVVATLWIAWSYRLPVRDPDGVAGPTYLQVPAIIVLAFLADVVPRTVARSWRTPRGLFETARVVAHERWPSTYLRFALAGMAVSYLCNSAFRNLKSYIPFVNRDLWDRPLDRVDRALWLGHDPAAVLHDLLGTGWAAHVLSVVYVAWLALIPITLAIALIWTRRIAATAWYVTALALNWAIGMLTYFLVPSLGPIYATPERFDDLPATYVGSLQTSMLEGRAEMLADPWAVGAVQPIAAFASLHVAIVVTMVLMAHLLGLATWIRVSGWVFLALTTLATVYLGWHYSVDALGGIVIGVAAVWIAAWGTGNHLGGRPHLIEQPVAVPSLLEDPQPVSVRRSSPA